MLTQIIMHFYKHKKKGTTYPQHIHIEQNIL